MGSERRDDLIGHIPISKLYEILNRCNAEVGVIPVRTTRTTYFEFKYEPAPLWRVMNLEFEW